MRVLDALELELQEVVRFARHGWRAESTWCRSITTEPSLKLLFFFLFSEGKCEGNCDIFMENKKVNWPNSTQWCGSSGRERSERQVLLIPTEMILVLKSSSQILQWNFPNDWNLDKAHSTQWNRAELIFGALTMVALSLGCHRSVFLTGSICFRAFWACYRKAEKQNYTELFWSSKAFW